MRQKEWEGIGGNKLIAVHNLILQMPLVILFFNVQYTKYSKSPFNRHLSEMDTSLRQTL